jgi:hypothetical protein
VVGIEGVVVVDEQPPVEELRERGLPRVAGEVGCFGPAKVSPSCEESVKIPPNCCVNARRTDPLESSRAVGATPVVLTSASRVQS